MERRTFLKILALSGAAPASMVETAIADHDPLEFTLPGELLFTSEISLHSFNLLARLTTITDDGEYWNYAWEIYEPWEMLPNKDQKRVVQTALSVWRRQGVEPSSFRMISVPIGYNATTLRISDYT